MITTLNLSTKQQSSTNWELLLASISDTDLDLLISANSKMQRGDILLTPRELEACIRWQPHLDTLLTVQQNL